MNVLYGLCVALSAFLLFSVEPMATRRVLPLVGGSSTVWLTALAFFQLALLAGYAYVVPVARASAERRGRVTLHLALLGAAVLSLLLPDSLVVHDNVTQHPQGTLFVLLAGLIGLPFVVLCTTSPLMQAWYARRERRPTPYRLFGLSNLCSLAALLAYPLLIEPYLRLGVEFRIWKAAFVVYALLAAGLTWRMREANAIEPEPSLGEPDSSSREGQRQARWLWFVLPGVASFQLAAVTGHLTQDVASMPLLWVVPLAAYLLSFVLAFELPRLYHRGLVLRLSAVLLFALGYFATRTALNVPIGLSIVLFTAELFCAAWFCHAELHALRPEGATASSRFYLTMAAGAAMGTLSVAVISPLVSDSNFDLPFAFLLTAALILWVIWGEGWAQRLLWSGACVLGVYLLFVLHAAYSEEALFRARNFYGALRVKQTRTPPQGMLSRTLYNGRIQHGMQWFSTEFDRTPLTYYAPDSGVGLALEHCCPPGRPRRIGVIGLGAGTLAAYGRAGDQIRFYDINPLVIDIAQHLFTYTRDTPASVVIVPGDARLSLAAEPPQNFDVLVVDAFTGDSIPTHLITREALTLYRRHLAPGGVLAFHISNQYLDLAPVLARLAESTRKEPGPLIGREIISAENESRGESLAWWVLLTGRAHFFEQPAFATARPLVTVPQVGLWTDDYSTLLPVLHWGGRHEVVP